MKADIYIQSSIKGFRHQDGMVGIVAEAQTSKGPATATWFDCVMSATKNRADLLGMKFALSRIKPECEIVFYIDSTYVVAAIENGWTKEWEKNGWRNSKNEKVANCQEWKDVLWMLGGRVPEFHAGADHKYKRWLESELARRAKKYG